MWKMLPLVNSEEEGEEFFAKWVDCQKGEKIAKINPTKKRKKLPKRRFISFFTTNIPSKHNPYISKRVIKQHEEEEEEEEREREREQKRISTTDMPRYYCEYCDAYLTHDSPTVRRQHISGFKHKANVRNYYLQFTDFNTNPNATMTTPTTMMPPNAMAMPGMMMGGGGVGGGGGGQMMPPTTLMPPPMMIGQQQPQSMMPPPKY